MFECKCCGKSNVQVLEKGTQKGLYCVTTGKWIKWLNKDDYNKFLLNIHNAVHTDTDSVYVPYKNNVRKYTVMNAITWREEYYGYDAHEALMAMTTCQECRVIIYVDGEQTHGITFKQYG